jgi:hypothetical protein
MTRASVERVLELARVAGIAIAQAEADEVADRFEALIRALEPLCELDLAEVEPVPVFPDDVD